MVFLAGWAMLYLLYAFSIERARLSAGWLGRLALLVVIVGLILTPFLWPIVQEQLTNDTAYMAVPAREGVGNDLLSFLVPNRLHPWFGPHFVEVNDRLGPILSPRSAYLGFIPIGLAIIGIIAYRQKARFWMLATLIFILLSMGMQIKFNGKPILPYYLPWAIPIIHVIRHPFRFTILVFLSLSVLVGYGARWVVERMGSHRRWVSTLVVILIACIIMVEYRVHPLPTKRASYSPFYNQLAREKGNFAIADIPTGRTPAKYAMFHQTIHGKKIIDGHISRTPSNAYDFIESNPLLRDLHADSVPDSELPVENQFAVLAERGIRYIILNKTISEKIWKKSLPVYETLFPPPFYQDELITVYRTTTEPNYASSNEIGIIDATLSRATIAPDAVLKVQVIWGATASPETNPKVRISLVNREGTVEEIKHFEFSPGWKTWSQSTYAFGKEKYAFHIQPRLSAGNYSLELGLVRPDTGQLLGEKVTVGEVTMLAPKRNFTEPKTERPVQAIFGDHLLLLGYDLEMTASEMTVTLHWKALQRMDVRFKFFLHVYDADNAVLVAQTDFMPHDWGYPTSWWESGEYVSDSMPISLEGFSPGDYWLALGVYNPDTQERLAISNQPYQFDVEDSRLFLTQINFQNSP